MKKYTVLVSLDGLRYYSVFSHDEPSVVNDYIDTSCEGYIRVRTNY